MYAYTFVQWLLFFYTYCFLGWVWESVYVSVRKKEITNRGFMTGPFLPIYGFGAVIVLLATIPVKENLFLVFSLGMIAATLLEYVTGVVMEAVFQVRYWDYTDKWCNIKGHICLGSSLAWGVFSILMIRFIQEPIEKVILSIPDVIKEIMAFLLSVGISVDVGTAIRDALDLKEMMMRIKENTEEMLKLQERLEMITAFLDDEKRVMKEKMESITSSLKEDEKIYLSRRIENLKERIVLLEQIKLPREGRKLERYQELKEELANIREKVSAAKVKMELHSQKVKKHTGKLLKRNPDAVSFQFKEALQEIKNMKK